MGARAISSALRLGAGLFAATALLAPLAQAGGLEVEPVVVYLSAFKTNEVVNIRNTSDDSARYQVTLTSWTQGTDGAIQTEPSKDLMVFPELFKLKRGAARNLRIGVKATQFGEVEKTYRIFITELPPPPKAGVQGVRVLTRLGIPVFLSPTIGPGAQGLVAGLAVQGPQVRFALTNKGNAHFKPLRVTLQARGADSVVLAEKKWAGWYVLAGGERVFEEALRPEVCGNVRFLQVSLEQEGSTTETDLATPQGACAR